jgi:hypothetical protein
MEKKFTSEQAGNVARTYYPARYAILALNVESVCFLWHRFVPLKFRNNAAHLVQNTRDVTAANFMKIVASLPSFNSQ